MEKKIIKLGYRGFYKSFKLEENIFFKYLIDKELIVIDNKNPEIIIYGEDSDLNKIYSNPKILFKVENIKYNDWNFKYSLSFKKKSENNFFFFNFFYYTSFQNYVNNEYDKNNLKLKNKIKNK